MIPSGSSACLIARRTVNRAGRREWFKLVDLQLADAVLGRDRAAAAVTRSCDEAGDRRALALLPVGGAPAGARTWKWTLPSPRWPKRGDAPGEGALDLAAASTMKRGMSRLDRDIVLERGPSSRSASEIVSRMLPEISACASLAAITASAIRPSPAPRRAVARARRPVSGAPSARSPRSARASVIARRAARASGIWRSTRSEQLAGTSSKPSTRAVAPREAEQVERRLGREPAQATARSARRAPGAGGRGDHAQRPFGPDQQLVETVAAIVLLERRPGRLDTCRRAGPLRPPRPARASCRNADWVPRRWSRRGRRWCSCLAAESQREAHAASSAAS